MSSYNRVYVGGWKKFCEDYGVTRKEPVEDFSWMGEIIQTVEASGRPGVKELWNPATIAFLQGTFPSKWSSSGELATFGTKSDQMYYEDCRDALAKVEGGKEYLKNYVAPKKDASGCFNDPIGKQIQLDHGHSGASYTGMLWSYKELLNDWDSWVLAYKERVVFPYYLDVQVAPAFIWQMLRDSEFILNGQSPLFDKTEEDVFKRAKSFGLENTMQEIHDICKQIYEENLKRTLIAAEKEKESEHISLMEALAFKARCPIRWFDTQFGSDIFPANPSEITKRALDEMELAYPGYKEHIENVTTALRTFYLNNDRWSEEGKAFVASHMKRYNVSPLKTPE